MKNVEQTMEEQGHQEQYERAILVRDEELKIKAPSLFQEQPYHEVSDKYHFIPTIDVIEEIKSHNWHPVSVSVAGVRDIQKDGYQQHCVRFRHFEDLLNPNENEILVEPLDMEATTNEPSRETLEE